jgi:predicted NAD-dependent protein-ADP-ribosyltransferase YbiA (DUF1768 family)
VNYHAKYKALGRCVNHPRRKQWRGLTHCRECVMARRKGGKYEKKRWVRILGVRVRVSYARHS